MLPTVWIPKNLTLVKVVGLTEDAPVDRTGLYSTQKDLSGCVYLEESLTIFDVAARNNTECSTLLVHTSETVGDAERNLLRKHLYGGPVLGMGGLRIPALVRNRNDVSILKDDLLHASNGLRPLPLFHIRALLGPQEEGSVAKQALQQLRMLSCVLQGGSWDFYEVAVNTGLSLPEEVLFREVLDDLVGATVGVHRIQSVLEGDSYRLENAVAEAANTCRKFLEHIPGATLNKEWVAAGVAELQEFPSERVASIIRKASRVTLKEAEYAKPRRQAVKERKALLTTLSEMDLPKYKGEVGTAIAGMVCAISWLAGLPVSAETGWEALKLFRDPSVDAYYSQRGLFESFSKLYLALSTKPEDPLAIRIRSYCVDKVVTRVSGEYFNPTNTRDLEELENIEALRPYLPAECVDTINKKMESVVEDLAVSCETVISSSREGVLKACKLIALADRLRSLS